MVSILVVPKLSPNHVGIGSRTERLRVRNKEAGKVLMLFPLSFYTYLLCPLLMGTDIWQEIEVLNQEFVRLGISQGST